MRFTVFCPSKFRKQLNKNSCWIGKRLLWEKAQNKEAQIICLCNKQTSCLRVSYFTSSSPHSSSFLSSPQVDSLLSLPLAATERTPPTVLHSTWSISSRTHRLTPRATTTHRLARRVRTILLLREPTTLLLKAQTTHLLRTPRARAIPHRLPSLSNREPLASETTVSLVPCPNFTVNSTVIKPTGA